MKVCSKCNKKKELNKFYRASQNKDGLRGQCKECTLKYNHTYYKKNAKRLRKNEKEHRQKNLKVKRQSERDYYKKNLKKIRIRKKNWYKENLDRERKRQRDWYKNHTYTQEYLEKKKKYRRDYYKLNKQKEKKGNKKWRKDNPEKRMAIENKRRAKKAGNGGSFTEQEWKELCDKYDNKCLCCGKKKKLTADHVIPLVKGGSSYIKNIQPLCKSCNSKKHIKTIDYRVNYE